MTWAKIDDQFPEHPKVVAVGEDAAWLTVKAICWSSRHLTDGFIPKVVAEHLAQAPGLSVEKAVEKIRRLVHHRLWDRVKGGYRVHDYLDYNPSKKSVLAERARKKRAGVLGAKARWGEGSVAGAMPPASPTLPRLCHESTTAVACVCYRRLHAPVPVPVPV